MEGLCLARLQPWGGSPTFNLGTAGKCFSSTECVTGTRCWKPSQLVAVSPRKGEPQIQSQFQMMVLACTPCLLLHIGIGFLSWGKNHFLGCEFSMQLQCSSAPKGATFLWCRAHHIIPPSTFCTRPCASSNQFLMKSLHHVVSQVQ